MSKKQSTLVGLSVGPGTKETQSSLFVEQAAAEETTRFNANIPKSLAKKLKQHCLDNDTTATAWLISQLEKL